MKIREIQDLPTSVDEIPFGTKGVHESCLRAYQILQKTKELLDRKVPIDVIRELIFEMESERGGGSFTP